MAKKLLVDRLVAAELGVDSHSLKRGQVSDEKFDELGKIIDMFSGLNLYIDDVAHSVEQICRRARKLQRQQPLGLIVIDYLQLIAPPSALATATRVRQIGAITKALKRLCVELEVPMILLSQLSRTVENRPGHYPILSDLRDSGEIEEDADSVVMLYREGYYDEDCDNPSHTRVLIVKNRDGETGSILLD